MNVPSFLQIEISAECNLRCVMCALRYRADPREDRRPAFMPFETYRGIIDQCAGARRVHLQGLGEPLMHPRFFDMARYAAGMGMHVTMNSNLLLLNAERAREMVASGLGDAYISIDGVTKETYERIRVRGDFDALTRNLSLLQGARDGCGSVLPRLRLVMVIMKQNLHELPLLVDFAKRRGVHSVFIQHLCHDFSEPENPFLRRFFREQSLLFEDPARVAEIFRQTRRAAGSVNMELHLPKVHPRGSGKPEGCEWPWKGIYVTWKGELMPCCMLSSADRMNFGSATSCDSIPALWNGSIYRDFRASIANRTPPSVCRTCSMYWGIF